MSHELPIANGLDNKAAQNNQQTKKIHRGNIKLPYVCCVCISTSYSYQKKAGLNDLSLLL